MTPDPLLAGSALTCSLLLSVIFHGLLLFVWLGVAETEQIKFEKEPLKVSLLGMRQHLEEPQFETPLASPPTRSFEELAPVKSKTAAQTKPKLPSVKQSSPEVLTQNGAQPELISMENHPPKLQSYSAKSPGSQGLGDGGNYEQLILAWLSKHKHYPERARERNITGEGKIRLVLGRSGEVKEFAIERSTSSTMLDIELREMVNRANPFPVPPPNYPGDSLAFVLPVSFTLAGRFER